MSSNIFIDIDNYEKLEKIGFGGFGKVYRVKEKSTDTIYAAKVSKNSMSTNEKEQLVNLLREVNLLSQMDHPSILKFIGFSSVNFSKEAHPVIITELLPNGSLDTLIKLEKNGESPSSWDNTHKLINIYGVASAMLYLHMNKIIHRDLKPENVLEDEYLFPKIADFGLSKIVHNELTISYQSQAVTKGTIAYLAPEIFTSNTYSKSGDVYAFAFLVFEVLMGHKAYDQCTAFNISQKVTNGDRPQFDKEIPNCYRDLVEACWAQDPSKRPEFDQIVERLRDDENFHQNIDKELFQNYVQLIRKPEDYLFGSEKPFVIKDFLEQQKKYNSFEKVVLKIKKNASNQDVQEIEDALFNEKIIADFIEDVTKSKSLDNLPQETIDYIKTELNQISSNPPRFKIASEKVDMLCENGSLISSYFHDVMNLFDKVSISIKYPTENFDKIMKQIYKLKKKVPNLTVIVNVSGINSLDNKLARNTAINVVNIKSPLECIENEAFRGCSSLISVSLPDTLKTIGNFSFSECSSLNNISLPSSVTTIGSYAFNDCSALTKFKIPSSILTINEYTFNGCLFLNEIEIPSSVTSICAFAFSECKNLIRLDIPASVTTIGEHAFNECSSISKLTLSKMNEIENYVFSECSSLTDINIPKTVKSIGVGSFNGCSSLKKLTVPSSVKNIGSNAFSNCTSLMQFTIPRSLNSISESCFNNCKSLAKITFNKCVTEIKDHAFDGCSALLKIEIPSTVNKIGPYAFHECSSLKEISIPSSVSVIEEFTFGCCKRLKYVTLRSSITKICSFAFGECTSIEGISIPSSVTKIEEHAFCGCSSLMDFEFPPSVTEIESYTLAGCSSLKEISIPSSVTKIGDYAFYDCELLEEIVIPSSVTSIGNWSFYNCKSLKELSIPSLVNFIGESAFSKCAALSKLTIPSSVNLIGKYAFSGCSSLVNVSIPSSVIVLENGIFSGCVSLSDVQIHSKMEKIGDLAFRDCSSLKNVSIPPSVTEIGKMPFYKCTSINEISIRSSLKKTFPHKSLGIEESVKINYT